MSVKTLLAAGLVCSTLMAAPAIADSAHSISFNHKGNPSHYPVTAKLVESNTSNGLQFSTTVQSVFCGEDLCKVDPVTLAWDQLGRYQSFYLAPGVKLEKGNAVPFSEEDYKKLEGILKNKHSSLADLEKNQLVAKVTVESVLDGFTGATIVLSKADYIEGAIWTCFTLWHFANGEISEKIRDIHGKSLGNKGITQLLVQAETETADVELTHFAIEQARKLAIHDAATAQTVLAFSTRGAPQLDNAIVDYVVQLPLAAQQSAFLQLNLSNNENIRRLALQALIEKDAAFPVKFWQDYSANLDQHDSYQEIYSLLRLLNKNQVADITVNENLANLLDNRNIYIARAVYWHLRKVQPSAAINEKLVRYYNVHQANL